MSLRSSSGAEDTRIWKAVWRSPRAGLSTCQRSLGEGVSTPRGSGRYSQRRRWGGRGVMTDLATDVLPTAIIDDVGPGRKAREGGDLLGLGQEVVGDLDAVVVGIERAEDRPQEAAACGVPF